MKKFFNRSEISLIKKDFMEIWNERTIRISIILTPVFAALVAPFVFLLMAVLMPEGAMGNEYRALYGLLPQELQGYTVRQGLFFVALDQVMPMLFLMIPILTGAMASSVFFAGEKERGTLETLLFSPVSPKKIGRIKWLSGTVISILITLASFLLLTIIGSVGDILLGIRFFIDLSWLITMFLLAPLLSLAAVLLTAFSAKRNAKQREAYKISSFLTLPVVLFYLLPFTGLYTITAPVLLALVALLLLLDIALVKNCERGFTTEKMLS